MDEEQEQDEQERKRAADRLFWALLLPLLGIIAYGMWVRFFPPREEIPSPVPNAFNLPEAPQAPAPPALPVPAPAPVAVERPAGERPGAGLAAQPKAPPAQPKAALPEGRAREREFISKYDPQVLAYQKDVLIPLTRRYRKRYPIVVEVDHAFGSLPRYMALVRQYREDRDAYKWARGVVALPEVRRTILKYAARPEVWSAAIQMSLEALKTPPSKPVYNEVERFMTSDPRMSDFVVDVSADVLPRMGTMVAQAAPAGTDIRPLQSLASKLAPPALRSGAQPPPASGK